MGSNARSEPGCVLGYPYGMDDDFTVATARAAGAKDALGEWVHGFLSSPGSDNAPLADQLVERLHHWVGPVRLSIDRLHRLAGPPDQPVLRPVDEDDWDDRVFDMEERIEDGWEPAPVIVSHQGDHLRLEDGNHRVESLRLAGRSDTWAVVGFEDTATMERFEAVRRGRGAA